jgi:hypothetical protein
MEDLESVSQDWQQNAREPYIDGLRADPVDLAVTAIPIFGHRSREMRFEEMQSVSRQGRGDERESGRSAPVLVLAFARL